MFTLSCKQKIGIFAKPSSKYLSQDFFVRPSLALNWVAGLLIRNRGDMWQAAIFKTRRTLSFINLEREKYQDSKGVFVWSKPSKWKELMVLLIKTSFSRLLDNILTTIKKSSCVRLSLITIDKSNGFRKWNNDFSNNQKWVNFRQTLLYVTTDESSPVLLLKIQVLQNDYWDFFRIMNKFFLAHAVLHQWLNFPTMLQDVGRTRA